MNSKSQQKKSELLGMPFGTACYRLRKLVLYELLRRHAENVCFKCGGKIKSADELSLEHKKPWQGSDPALFWEIGNVAFSHARCNIRGTYVRREVSDGNLWRPGCKLSLPVNTFHKLHSSRTGYTDICKRCSNERRKQVLARGDCTDCGARRGTKDFRPERNLCRECYLARYRDYNQKARDKKGAVGKQSHLRSGSDVRPKRTRERG